MYMHMFLKLLYMGAYNMQVIYARRHSWCKPRPRPV